MCFGGGSQPQQQAAAAAPAAPAPVAIPQPVGSARKAEDEANFGGQIPKTRVDRSTTGGGIKAGGSGVTI